ncbi:MAG: hypothetical protein L3J98_15435 [Gammaproteobacteria bacterium]|nr:hypothetical protein [Gammaproteobacteria bacterium]MCF6261529.1 hypothetical protein [Gammaproteobacteria bacterium]
MKNDFHNEWVILHGDIEKYERFSLVIKLVSVLTSVFSMAFIANGWIAVVVILVLWLQDGIWKTFQKRLETRVVVIEQKLKNKSDENNTAFQLYSQWGDKRQGTVGLVKEYLLNSIKPTVAYPYAVLVLLVFIYYQLAA